jgi:predicted TIM-barrel fold metal-dependent hydrolase
MENQGIIDIHAHIFPEKVAARAVESIGKYYGLTMTGKGTASDLLKSGSRINACKYIVHSTATKVEQVRSINNFIAAKQAENDSFIGFGTLHPGLSDVDSEVERIISLGLQGIKLHPEFQEFNIDDEDMLKIYKALEGMFPLLIHVGDENKTSSSPRRLSKIIKLFPNLTVIAAHLGGYQMWEESAEYLVGRNLYFDTSSSLFKLDSRKASEIIRMHGVEKVLFGSDFPMWSHEEELKRFNRLDLTEEERRLILSGNAKRLLKLE